MLLDNELAAVISSKSFVGLAVTVGTREISLALVFCSDLEKDLVEYSKNQCAYSMSDVGRVTQCGREG